MAAVYERGGVWYAVPRPIPLARVVRGAILNAMAYTNGHQTEAAALLGLSPRQLSYNLRVYHVPTAHASRAAPRARRRGRLARVASPRPALRRVK